MLEKIGGKHLAILRLERSVGDIETRSQLVHAHAVVLEQNIQNFDADIRTKCFKDVQPIIQ